MNTTPPALISQSVKPLPLPAGTSLHRQPDGTIVGRFQRLDLASVFQPLVSSVDTNQVVGQEAFVRVYGRGDLGLSPWGLFSLADNGRALVDLDRLCRVVHTLNFQHFSTDKLLFMNVHGRLLEAVADNHGRSFRELIEIIGFPAKRVVIEIPHTANENRRLLALAVANYHRNGFMVALNVQNLDVLAGLQRMIQADYFKLDTRALTTSDNLERLAIIASNSPPIVCTRIGTQSMLDACRKHPGLLLQGHAISPPRSLEPHTSAYAIYS